MYQEKRAASSFDKFRTIKPKALRLSQEQLVTKSYLDSDTQFPLVMQPGVEHLNLVAWTTEHRGQIEEELMRHGAILFRGFNLEGIAEFEGFVRAISPDLMNYGERSSPRSKIGDGVYTSTDHPSDQHILLHNEQSYTLNWPMKLWFFCVQPAEQQGRTPIADSRKIFNHLDGRITEKFIEKQVMYVRNYGHGLGLPWREVFGTEDRTQVEEHCRRAEIEFEWKEGDGLRTRQVRPAVRTHPKTGEQVWFNHTVFFHISSLEAATRDSMLAVVAEDELPFNTFYGDGAPIEPSVLEEIWQAYWQETTSFPWMRGDVLMLDNMLVSHGREPFTGERHIAVAMAEPYQSQVVKSNLPHEGINR
ncbi:MAG: TauD/TfdA family dioxygenase [Pyrinomonadaceae bacterium]